MGLEQWLLTGGLIVGSGGIGGLAAVLLVRSQSRKTNAEADKVDAETHRTRYDTWAAERDYLIEQIGDLRDRVVALECEGRACKEREIEYLRTIARLEEARGTEPEGIVRQEAALHRATLHALKKPDEPR